MKYLAVYIFLGLLFLSSVVMGLHKKTIETNHTITNLLSNDTKTNPILNKEKQMRCSLETPTTRRMVEIPRGNPHGGIGQPITGQPPSQFQNFDPYNRTPDEAKIFQNGSTKCFSCETQPHQQPHLSGTRDYTFNNPSKCFDCEKQVKQCTNSVY